MKECSHSFSFCFSLSDQHIPRGEKYLALSSTLLRNFSSVSLCFLGCNKAAVSAHTNLEVTYMDYPQDLPMGFGIALLQNRDAEIYFDSLSESERRRLIEKTHSIDSKKEMQAFVDSLKTQ